jgi:hypothetical protein
MSDDKKKSLARLIAGRMSSMAPQQVDGVRSTKGEIKGFLTKDTLYRLRQAVADHQKAADEGADARLAVILGICDSYIDRHGAETDARAREKLAAVEDIKAEAMVERGRRQAEARYLQDAYAKKTAAEDSPQFSSTRMTEQSVTGVQFAHPQTKALAKGQASKEEGYNQATLDLIKKYGLTEAEVLAVKVYSADDYKYINPATAYSESWMKSQNLATKKGNHKAEDDSDEPEEHSHLLIPTDDPDLSELSEAAPEDYLATEEGQNQLKLLFEEGSLHGAMAIAALQKLPHLEGLCYRGERMTEADFEEMYGDSDNSKLPAKTLLNLTSIATEQPSAQTFANGVDSTPIDATVSVMTCVHVKTGRDIGDLSLHGRKEKEWLLLPGTVLQTDSVEEFPDGTRGRPPATKWVVVQSQEV